VRKKEERERDLKNATFNLDKAASAPDRRSVTGETPKLIKS
jgi:hypothetical protein